MEKRIAIWSYWLGLVCAVLTIVLRGLAAFGMFPILPCQRHIQDFPLRGPARRLDTKSLKPCSNSHQLLPKE